MSNQTLSKFNTALLQQPTGNNCCCCPHRSLGPKNRPSISIWEHKASKVSSCSVEMRYMLLKPGLQRARKRGSVECHHECDLTKLYRFQQCRIAGVSSFFQDYGLKLPVNKKIKMNMHCPPSTHIQINPIPLILNTPSMIPSMWKFPTKNHGFKGDGIHHHYIILTRWCLPQF